MNDKEWHDTTGVEWEEAERFHDWIKVNAAALRERIAKMKDDNPRIREFKGIVIASNLYRRFNGAPVASFV
jgi:hypothetical protein